VHPILTVIPHLTRIFSESTSRLISGGNYPHRPQQIKFSKFSLFLFLPNQLIFLKCWYAILLVVAIPLMYWCITRNIRTITVDFHFFVYIYIVVAFAHPPGALRHYVDCRPQW